MNRNQIAMVILTSFQIPSFICAVLIILRFTQRRSPLKRLQNHLLLYLLLFATFTITIELPNAQKFLWSGNVTIEAPWFCTLWNALFSSMATLNRDLIAFISVERHLIVFSPYLYRTKRSRILCHYIPLILIITFVLVYIFMANIFASCPRHSFYYSVFMCGYTCALTGQYFGTIHAWIFVFMPTMIAAIASIALPIRFVIQKRQLQRTQWHNARKMIVQTTLIAGAYMICWLPYTIILELIVHDNLALSNSFIIMFFTLTPYITSLLTPFIVLHTVSKWMNSPVINRIKDRFFVRHRPLVHPNTRLIITQRAEHTMVNGHPNTARIKS